VVESLSADLPNAFHQISGFSSRNIWRMRSFYLAWTEEIRKLPQAVAVLNGENLPPPVAEIQWGHNILLLEKLKSPSKRLWYALRSSKHPVGVAEYKLTKTLPKKYQAELPAPKELKEQLRTTGKGKKEPDSGLCSWLIILGTRQLSSATIGNLLRTVILMPKRLF